MTERMNKQHESHNTELKKNSSNFVKACEDYKQSFEELEQHTIKVCEKLQKLGKF